MLPLLRPQCADMPCACAGALPDLIMMTLHSWIGWFSFLIYAAVAFSGAVLCYKQLPETKGRTLVRICAAGLAGCISMYPDCHPLISSLCKSPVGHSSQSCAGSVSYRDTALSCPVPVSEAGCSEHVRQPSVGLPTTQLVSEFAQAAWAETVCMCRRRCKRCWHRMRLPARPRHVLQQQRPLEAWLCLLMSSLASVETALLLLLTRSLAALLVCTASLSGMSCMIPMQWRRCCC